MRGHKGRTAGPSACPRQRPQGRPALGHLVLDSRLQDRDASVCGLSRMSVGLCYVAQGHSHPARLVGSPFSQRGSSCGPTTLSSDFCSPSSSSSPATCIFLQEALPDHTGGILPRCQPAFSLCLPKPPEEQAGIAVRHRRVPGEGRALRRAAARPWVPRVGRSWVPGRVQPPVPSSSQPRDTGGN